VEKWVLVISSQPAFGDLIKSALIENVSYHVQTAYFLDDLQKIDFTNPMDLLIIDVDLTDPNWVDAVEQLQTKFPFTKTIVFAGSENHTIIQNQIHVDSFFEKPFYLPKFLKEIKVLFAIDESNASAYPQNDQKVTFTHNLEDLIPSLEYVLNKCDAKQIVYFVNNLPYASSGNLGDFVTLDISSFLESRRFFPQHIDLIRYYRFPGDPSQYLIYIKSLNEFDKLVMIFDGQIPLEKAKSQINSVTKFLNDPTYYRTMENGDMPKIAVDPESDSLEFVKEITDGTHFNIPLSMDLEKNENLINEETEIMTIDALVADSQEMQLLDEQDRVDLPSQLIDTQPDQEQAPQDFLMGSGILTHDFLSDWINEAENWESTDQNDIPTGSKSQEENEKDHQPYDEKNFLADITFPWDEEKIQPLQDEPKLESDEIYDSSSIIDQSLPPISEVADPEFLSEIKPNPKRGMKIFGQSIPDSENTLEPETYSQSSISMEDQLGKTQPRKVVAPVSNENEVPENHSVGLVHLGYTFLLIPRFPNQYLTNNLAKNITTWIPNLCLAFGWRLDRLTVRPLYLSWSINAPSTIAPNKIIARIRKETSKRILKDFPEYFRENPSNDFWAPGYLLVNDSSSPTKPMIVEYIKQTRRYQGLTIHPKI